MEELKTSMSELWNLLTDEEQVLLAEHVSLQQFNDNDTIYESGDEATFLPYLLEGGVKLLGKGVARQQQIVRMVQPNAFFGLRPTFIDEPHHYTAIAMQSSSVLMLPLQLIRQLIMSNHRVALFFIQNLSDMLERSTETVITLSQKHMRGRLADMLLMVKSKYGTEADDQTLRIRLSRAEWANISNMTISNAIRTLSAFSSEGILALQGRRISILKEEELMQIAKRG